LGEERLGDDDCNDSPSARRAFPAHLGHFTGCNPEEATMMQSSMHSLTTGSSENDKAIVFGMVKSASSRLRRECVDDCLLATIKKSGTVGWLRHSQIELGDKLGEGSFSNVFGIRKIRTNKKDPLSHRCLSPEDISDNSLNSAEDSKDPVASQLVIKILKSKLVRRPSVLSMCTADLVKEGAILASLGKHRNVVSLVAWTPTGLGGFGDSSDGIRHDSFFLVMSRLEKSLKDRLEDWKIEARKTKSMGKVDGREKDECFRERFKIMTDLANALQHVHSKRIIHRDLKPNNIGFDSSGTLKLFDFDVSRIIPKVTKTKSLPRSKSGENETFQLTQHVGTQRYMSPECARGEPYNVKADIYAFGLVCHELLTLKLPYTDLRRSEDHFRKVYLQHQRPSLPRKWPRALRSFISNCWSDSISNRPTAEKAFNFLSEEAQIIASAMEKKRKSNSIKSAFESFRAESQNLMGRKGSVKEFLSSKCSSFQDDDPAWDPNSTQSTTFGTGFAKEEDVSAALTI